VDGSRGRNLIWFLVAGLWLAVAQAASGVDAVTPVGS
jgi:uncharacterized membrane protein YccF (DUF307 family)